MAAFAVRKFFILQPEIPNVIREFHDHDLRCLLIVRETSGNVYNLLRYVFDISILIFITFLQDGTLQKKRDIKIQYTCDK